jgi:CRP-like cAMP-binding protein
MIDIQQLSKLGYLANVSASSLAALAQSMVEKSFAAEEILVKEGDPSEAVYLIAAGQVSVRKKTDIIAHLTEGEFFGEMSFFDKKPYSATIVADAPTRAFVLPRTALEKLLAENPKMALEQILVLLSGLSSRLRNTTRDLVVVLELARLIGGFKAVDELLSDVAKRLVAAFESQNSVACYRWNPYNNEYTLLAADGPSRTAFPPTAQPEDTIALERGQTLSTPIQSSEGREGLFLVHSESDKTFSLSDRQLVETIAGVLSSALVAGRAREEEISRQKLERSRQGGFYL